MLKVLIVDDEKIIRETIADLIDWDALSLQLIGTAKDGIEAYNIILDEYPEIVLTDIKMPGLSGLDLIQRIHAVNKDTQFIILSGYGEFEYAKKAMQYGVRHYLLKPCNEEQIIDSLKDVRKDYADYLTSKDTPPQSFIARNMNLNLMVGIMNDSLSPETDKEFSYIFSNYKRYLDFDNVPYEIFYIYFVTPESYPLLLEKLQQFRDDICPGIAFNIIYVYNTLIFFFKSVNDDLGKIYNFLDTVVLDQSVTIKYRHDHCPNLSAMLKELIPHIKKYEIIYFTEGSNTLSIYNYQNIIKEVQRLTASIYSPEKASSGQAFLELKSTLSSLSDADFLKQLASSVIIFSVARLRSFDMVDAAEFLIKLEKEKDCREISNLLDDQLTCFFEEYHSQKYTGDISHKIQEYVESHICDSGLSLKWIAENYLFMNVDYLSKRFLKETGCKFSRYLTDMRIKRAKEILASSDLDSIQNVADMVGCGNNPQYFSQIFKKSTGMSPSKYMKMLHGDAGY
ncbi:response regulator transcription factor [[Clostridium] hylemonae]|uniref:response regulator transcription factor n=1 Tax=[Clostridium] hylemonae TaxID=89153 RepID=UPI001FCB26D9|nr:response regulator [[Clostridium] hylemonae]BDF03170.1 hypothetical protein CE91St63_02320 [[Clostridium] hylemonae]